MRRSRLRDLGGADPYRLLGVPPTADRDTIVRAHRRLIRVAHPDLPSGDEERAKLLHLARDILLDPEERREYDNLTAVTVGLARAEVRRAQVWQPPPSTSESGDEVAATAPAAPSPPPPAEPSAPAEPPSKRSPAPPGYQPFHATPTRRRTGVVVGTVALAVGIPPVALFLLWVVMVVLP